ncbi:hypothetical protein Hanom_Chr16g01469211 [Helianthus anomalus]
MDDRIAQEILSLELSKVSKIEDYVKDLSKSMSENPINVELDKELKQDYLDHIMKLKPYKANGAQFKDWSIDALKEEIERIKKFLNDPSQKPTPPDWKKGKQIDPNKALKLKKMIAVLVAANYGNARSIARWSESKIVETYKRLEQFKGEDPIVPQKAVYLTVFIPQQTLTSKTLPSTSCLSITALNQAKGRSRWLRLMNRC